MLSEIGKITVAFSYIEHSLAELIGKIVTVGGRPRALGDILTAELSFKQRIGTLESLLLFALGKEHDFTKQFLQAKFFLFKAEQERNLVIHSLWGAANEAEDPNKIVRVKTTAKQKRGLRTDYVSMDLNDLKRITEVLARAVQEACLLEIQLQASDTKHKD